MEHTSGKGKRRTWKLIFAGSLLTMICAAAVLFMADAPLNPYEDLLPVRVADPDPAANGFLYLKERWSRLPAVPARDQARLKALIKGEEPPDPVFLGKMRKGLENSPQEWRTALAMPEWRLPAAETGSDLAGWVMRPLGVFLFDAMVSLRAGDAGPAVSLQEELLLWRRRNLEGAGGLVPFLVSGTVQNLAAELGCAAVAAGKTSPEQWDLLARPWDEKDEGVFASAWQTAMRNEGEDFRAHVEKRRSNSNFRDKFQVKRNRTLNSYHDIQRKVMAASFRPFPTLEAAQEAGLKSLTDSEPSPPGGWDPNARGEWLLNGARLIGKLVPALYTSLFVPRAMRVRLAVHRWQQAHPGQWPSSLTELIPDYLPEVPKDPWNGDPLLWDHASRTVYAVGTDWKPDRPVFKKDSGEWLATDSETPGLRMELPPAP